MTLRNTIMRHIVRNPIYLTAQLGLGVAVLNDVFFLVIGCLVIIFIWIQNFFTSQFNWRRLFAIYGGTVIYMMTIMSWYRGIEPHGWSTIAGLSPNVVLLIAVFVGSLFCSLFITVMWLTMRGVIAALRISRPIGHLLIWASGMMLAEIILSTAFSLFVTQPNAPIAPTWNMFSIATISVNSPLSDLPRLFGFWGMTWILSIVSGGIYLLAVGKGRLGRRQIVVATIVVALGFVLIRSNGSPAAVFNTLAVSQRTDQHGYLEQLHDTVEQQVGENPVLVVLPEYSSLLHPFSSNAFSQSYDARYSYPETFSDKNVYFIGTEPEQHGDALYLESYIANGSLQKTKRRGKTFLIPGGEYIIPWIRSIISNVDMPAVNAFASTRDKVVVNYPLEPDIKEHATQPISIAACSTLLLPYYFQEDVKSGAQLLTANVSYEQFIHAPEYERFAERFARFHANALDRWMIVGARSGDALIIAPDGTVRQRAEKGDTARETVYFNTSMTPYAHLGEKVIVVLLSICSLFAAIAVSRHRRGAL